MDTASTILWLFDAEQPDDNAGAPVAAAFDGSW
jgi:hypothetical protein